MFQNDDVDLIAERVNPANPNQVWFKGQWVELQSRTEQIEVKGAAPVELTLRRSPHGPIINDALGKLAGSTPIRHLSKVVLPTPLRPSSDMTLPFSSDSDTPRKVCEEP